MVELEVVVVFVICMVGCEIMSWHIGVGDGFGAGLCNVLEHLVVGGFMTDEEVAVLVAYCTEMEQRTEEAKEDN